MLILLDSVKHYILYAIPFYDIVRPCSPAAALAYAVIFKNTSSSEVSVIP